ncbi:MAG: HipA domain-containing protein [Oscillospiraceae bacterium]|nr:HipA domain-containing protein [Oscillospiraceae bacterium]MDD4368074.1 HipA domain-containing protein [Oscillospiraceae bacterium]
MNCLCCGQPLPESEQAQGWHRQCIKRFFGSRQLPQLELSHETLLDLARQSLQQGYTLAGVQKKLSLHLNMAKSPRLTLRGYPAGYILKPQVEEFSCMPESEQLVMSMADRCGIRTVPHALIYLQDHQLAYISKRVDRPQQTSETAEKLAMEDFCQLDLRLTQDKYNGSYERCAKLIKQYSFRPGLDLAEFFLRLVFCYLSANSDMHLKNFSLLETSPGSAVYTLSPAYDLLPVNIIMPEDSAETALTLNGKKRQLRRKDFLQFAAGIGLNQNAALRLMQSCLSKLPELERLIAASLLPAAAQERFTKLLQERARKLRPGET